MAKGLVEVFGCSQDRLIILSSEITLTHHRSSGYYTITVFDVYSLVAS
jgi:hypothetical protein